MRKKIFDLTKNFTTPEILNKYRHTDETTNKNYRKLKTLLEIYIIERIIRKNKNKYLVQWRNYSNDFNSWIDKDDVVKYT